MLDIKASGCEAGTQDGGNGHLSGEGQDGCKCSKGERPGVVGGEFQAGVAEGGVCVGQYVHKASSQDHSSCTHKMMSGS